MYKRISYFMMKRDQSPVLLDIKMENFDDVCEPLEVAKKIYEHEKKVTATIYKLQDMVKKADDYATEIFIKLIYFMIFNGFRAQQISPKAIFFFYDIGFFVK